MSEPLDPPQPPASSPPPPPEGGGSTFTPPPAGGDGGGGGGGGPTPPPGNPWDQRDRLGFVSAFIENIKLFALSPGEAYARTRRTGDYVGPIVFAILVGWIGAFFNFLWNLLFQGSIMSVMPAEVREQMGASMMLQGGSGLVGFIIYPIFAVIGLFIGAGILHLCAMLVGALSGSDSGFEGTFRAVAFASVANLAYVVPLVGGLIALVWTIILLVIGISTLHRTTQGKALITVLIPIGVCCLCLILMVLGGAAMIAGLAGSAN